MAHDLWPPDRGPAPPTPDLAVEGDLMYLQDGCVVLSNALPLPVQQAIVDAVRRREASRRTGLGCVVGPTSTNFGRM